MPAADIVAAEEHTGRRHADYSHVMRFFGLSQRTRTPCQPRDADAHASAAALPNALNRRSFSRAENGGNKPGETEVWSRDVGTRTAIHFVPADGD